MSRVARFQEHLKTGFTAEATSAARCRANAARAEKEGLANLAAAWRDLAAEKDRLAIGQLEAAGQVREAPVAIADALAEDRFENDVLYPKIIRSLERDEAAVFEAVVEAQEGHVERLRALRSALQAATGDIS